MAAGEGAHYCCPVTCGVIALYAVEHLVKHSKQSNIFYGLALECRDYTISTDLPVPSLEIKKTAQLYIAVLAIVHWKFISLHKVCGRIAEVFI